MVSCKEIVDKANDYLDGQISLPKRIGFRMHLFMCHHCNRYVRQLKTTIETLTRIEVPKCCDDETQQKIVETLKNQDSNK
jgi:hypothetical protein